MSESDYNRSGNLSATLEALITDVKSLRREADNVDEWPFRFPQDAEVRQHIGKVMLTISDTFTMFGLAAELALFPLLKISQRYHSGYDITKTELRAALDRTLYLLTERLKLIDRKAFLRVAETQQVADLLKAARHRKGDSQEQAAQTLEVSADSVKSWESSRNHPSTAHLTKLAEYIESAFK